MWITPLWRKAVFVASVFMNSQSPRKLSISHLWQNDFFCVFLSSHISIYLVARCPCIFSDLPPPPDTTQEYASTISKSTLCEEGWDQPSPSLATRVIAWRWERCGFARFATVFFSLSSLCWALQHFGGWEANFSKTVKVEEMYFFLICSTPVECF